ncbi:MAG: hypothetical protein JXR44_00775 [Thiotrichales bacterium]|nr:hypothetical protein [Thiotrichales bacterium]
MMLPKLAKQQGAMMLETAYVLPILVGVVLFIIETLSYAMNSILVNDVLTDLHLTIIDEVQAVSQLEEGQAVPANVLYAFCDNGTVRIPVGSNDSMLALVQSALEQKRVEMLQSDPGRVTVTAQTESNFDLYLVRFDGTANSLILPGFLNQLLPIQVDTVISIKASCQNN